MPAASALIDGRAYALHSMECYLCFQPLPLVRPTLPLGWCRIEGAYDAEHVYDHGGNSLLSPCSHCLGPPVFVASFRLLAFDSLRHVVKYIARVAVRVATSRLLARSPHALASDCRQLELIVGCIVIFYILSSCLVFLHGAVASCGLCPLLSVSCV